ncbi:hypothetical protein [Flavobacterium sp. MDT1-60]|uniref:hypothetical protein n=1 Tax=Flavobacterium sp. MDT1-60 TaxID=1979344 RepID=UPI00177BB9BC|nr:hypothetical protein [Flavobacterium sp. MDT1-60]QOG03482.1 hypothetical protein IHE43_04360 [Flavobacterium sp. MDT1-60]
MRNINLPDNSNSMVDLEKALTYKDGTLKYELKQKEKKIISEFYQKYDDLLGEPHDDFKAAHF